MKTNRKAMALLLATLCGDLKVADELAKKSTTAEVISYFVELVEKGELEISGADVSVDGIEADGVTLKVIDGKLSVNTANVVEQDNTLPVASAAVHTVVGNIEVLLNTI